MRTRFASLTKFILCAIGRVGFLRDLWLAWARWTLCEWPLSRRWRNVIIWELATYILGYGYQTKYNSPADFVSLLVLRIM